MKNYILSIILMIIFTSSAYTQSPQAINYQAVARDTSGVVLAGQNLAIRISILQNAIDGNAVFVETHDVSTTSLGLINLAIGTGTLFSGDFSSINWGGSSFYLKTEIDASGNDDYTLLDVAVIQATPYALHANSLTLTDANGVRYYVVVDTLGNISTAPVNP